jgi:hypothetical protein
MKTMQNTEPETATETGGPLTDIQCELIGHDGNAFAILGRVRKALKENGREDLVEPFTTEAMSGSYGHLLMTCHKYVHVH